MMETTDASEETYTLLGVRSDGVASVVDLIAAAELEAVRFRARALLREHASCETVEIWFDGSMVEQHEREGGEPPNAPKPARMSSALR